MTAVKETTHATLELNELMSLLSILGLRFSGGASGNNIISNADAGYEGNDQKNNASNNSSLHGI